MFQEQKDKNPSSLLSMLEFAYGTTPQVKLTIVGIRNYCPGGEQGLPQLFERLPEDSDLYLKIDPPGTAFAGAVSVYDTKCRKIGNVLKTDRFLIERAIPRDGMLSCKVAAHSLNDHCIYVKADNLVGFAEPFIRETEAEPDEIIFRTTSYDQQIQNITQLLLALLKEKTPDKAKIKEMASEYAKVCCMTLDGETTFLRAAILWLLEKMNEGGEFTAEIKEIFESKKDLCRMSNDVKKQVCKAQYERILASATERRDGMLSELDSYAENLRYRHGGRLTKRVLEAEIQKLSALLASEFTNSYVTVKDDENAFATAVYAFNYTLRSLYVLYSRRIKRDYLEKLLLADNEGEATAKKNADVPNNCAMAIQKALTEKFKNPAGAVLNSGVQIKKAASVIDVSKNAETAMLMAIGMELGAVRARCTCPEFVRALIALGVIAYVDNAAITRMANGMSKKLNGTARNGHKAVHLPANHLRWSTVDQEIGNKIFDAMKAD